MKLITRDTDYGLRALCFIAKQKEGLVSASELVRQLKIPRPFLRKILQALNKGRVLNSCKGLHGGFKLAKSADKIYLLELIRIFQGPLKINECSFKKAICPNVNTCALRKKICAIEKQVVAQLGAITIASLINRER